MHAGLDPVRPVLDLDRVAREGDLRRMGEVGRPLY
jgi:hypothetical protein